MRIDWDTPVDVLMHGGNISYIDLDEDEIMHWKYIKRVKLSNGKWRYYYDERDVESAKLNLDKAVAARDRADHRIEDAEKNRNAAYDKMMDAQAKYDSTKNLKSYLNGSQQKALGEYLNAQSEYSTAEGKLQEAKEKKSAAHEKVVALEKKYKKTKIKTFAARTISKGLVKVANLFAKLFG